MFGRLLEASLYGTASATKRSARLEANLGSPASKGDHKTHLARSSVSTSAGQNVIPSGKGVKNGRGGQIRTDDPHTPSVMRYHAALRPVFSR